MGWLDSLYQTASQAWDSAKEELFGSSERDKAVADLNRVVSVLVVAKAQLDDIRRAGKKPPVQLSDAYLAHHANVRGIIQRLCMEDSGWRIALPDIIGMGFMDCVTELPYAQWRQQVRTIETSAAVNGLNGNGLGAVFLVPVVIAVVAVAVGSTAYFLTAEGRARMDVAQRSADTVEAIARGVAEGRFTAAEAQQMIDSLPKPPDHSGGGLFDNLGKMAVGGLLLLGGVIIVSNKLSK